MNRTNVERALSLARFWWDLHLDLADADAVRLEIKRPGRARVVREPFLPRELAAWALEKFLDALAEAEDNAR